MQVPKPVKEELGGGLKEFALSEVSLLVGFVRYLD